MNPARRTRVLRILLTLALVLLPAVVVGPAEAHNDETSFLIIELDRVTPDIVTVTGDADVVVDATITNVGDRPVRDVVARLERAAPISASAELRTTFGDAATSAYSAVGPFVDVAAEMQPGQRTAVTFRYPLRAAPPSLDVENPGVYPLLVNVNGTPDYGAPARLADARFLLPVIGVPSPAPAVLDGEAAAPVPPIPPDTSAPVPLTMLWPLADRPRLAPGIPGGTTPRLIDDDLATELAPGGRLDVLVSAAEAATAPPADPDGQLGRSLCLAIDPDLLITVNAMTGDYVVTDSPDGRGASRPGTGQAAAAGWLERLRALASHLCVVALPFGQADLAAVQRVGEQRLATQVTTGSADLVDRLLGVSSLREATIFGDAPLNPDAVALLGSGPATVAIAPAEAGAVDAATGGPATADVRPARVAPRVTLARFDPAVAATLGAVGTPVTPSYLDPSMALPATGSATGRRLDAMGALLWRSLDRTVTPRTEIVVPPPTWGVGPDDAPALLRALAAALSSGIAVPRPLSSVVAETAGLPPQPEAEVEPGTPAGRFDDDVTATIADQDARLWNLTSALGTDPQSGLTGLSYTAPLREDWPRALSQSRPDAERNDAARASLGVVGATIDDLQHGVTIVNPGESYTLATERSPLPLVLRNDLAVPVRVRLLVEGPPGMKVTDLGELEVPPGGFRPIQVPIEVHFTQRFAVDVSLQTPGGLPLGEPVRLSLHSNAYGKVLFFITLIAGVTLAILTGRRLWHRFHGQPDRADLVPPEPHLPDRDRPDPDGDPPPPPHTDPARGPVRRSRRRRPNTAAAPEDDA
ncbi:hypothetical protein MINS_05570 [Mycolicibacterium insubricum]|uniref:Uncharacterized protein n=1 Tax=Mycolicibacterium insubricum TaxID=444597 RepID=A0A1X0DIH1_9MYCO|nr:DUF6049 family protein [Mycolicibacterium insubricum]ORA71640.1 hypothetical protein BST26_07625 [Mycolicibacterium insubricum]BBZ65128.1 hypothetical protein MINS_05570 [Mycolicibacterium insubricum]